MSTSYPTYSETWLAPSVSLFREEEVLPRFIQHKPRPSSHSGSVPGFQLGACSRFLPLWWFLDKCDLAISITNTGDISTALRSFLTVLVLNRCKNTELLSAYDSAQQHLSRLRIRPAQDRRPARFKSKMTNIFAPRWWSPGMCSSP
jgi:hypothetical protein